YQYFLFEKDDRALDDLSERCRKGEILCGECKQLLTQRINEFLEEHQRKREEAKERLHEFMLPPTC
ncbi:MAG: tryptophan--tRNA ligase, partial [Methanomassiliicoccales archaeon]|nr:tryptophan--tRNA ligase [Methanomassiliicoccales archaeon]